MAEFARVYGLVLLVILGLMTVLWLASLALRNTSIVDIFWGPGFLVAAALYFDLTDDGYIIRKIIVLSLVIAWSLRLGGYLLWRNAGQGEDFRYQKMRQSARRDWWWQSYLKVFLLQGVVMWLVSLPLLGAQIRTTSNQLNWLDALGIIVWAIGFAFESIGDWQLARFKRDLKNKGQLLTTGLWYYTRHPNYFGDACVWWGFGLLSLAAGSVLPILGSLLMTYVIVRVSGVAFLERSLRKNKTGYEGYMARTSSFLPLPPKKQ
jgi:steroid 5-alpha reductase family enzyme